MTTHISDLIKWLKDEGYTITTAANLPNKKAPTEAVTSGEAQTNIN